MKKFLLAIIFLSLALHYPAPARAATGATPGLLQTMFCGFSSGLTVVHFNIANTPDDPCIKNSMSGVPQNQVAFFKGYFHLQIILVTSIAQGLALKAKPSP
jgi:hypothetical protein